MMPQPDMDSSSDTSSETASAGPDPDMGSFGMESKGGMDSIMDMLKYPLILMAIVFVLLMP